MPHTVRPAGRAASPATSITNVVNDGALKHGRNGSSTRISETGRLPARSIGGTLSHRVTRQPPMLPHISGKIIPTRRIEHTFPKKAESREPRRGEEDSNSHASCPLLPMVDV